MTQEFKVGDKVKLANDTIAEVNRSVVRIEGSWFFAGDLELVERPRPALKVGDVIDGPEASQLSAGSVLRSPLGGAWLKTGRGWQTTGAKGDGIATVVFLGDPGYTILHIGVEQ